MSRILIADDQRDVLEALRILLKSEGHQTDAVTSLTGILNALEKKDYGLLMMDLNYTRDTTSGQEGLEVIPKIQQIDNTLRIYAETVRLELQTGHIGNWNVSEYCGALYCALIEAGASQEEARKVLEKAKAAKAAYVPPGAREAAGVR